MTAKLLWNFAYSCHLSINSLMRIEVVHQISYNRSRQQLIQEKYTKWWRNFPLELFFSFVFFNLWWHWVVLAEWSRILSSFVIEVRLIIDILCLMIIRTFIFKVKEGLIGKSKRAPKKKKRKYIDTYYQSLLDWWYQKNTSILMNDYKLNLFEKYRIFC